MSDTAERKIRQLSPVRASPAIEAGYRKRITRLIDEMHRSIVYWLSVAYRQNEPAVTQLAQDEAPALILRRTVRRLARRWQKRFNDAADDLARYFAEAVAARSTIALHRALAKGGFSVKFKLTPAMRDVLQAQIAENVALIRSIPSQHFTQIEGYVMRSVQTGRDLGQLTGDRIRQYGVTKRRAAFIARDQSNKATAIVQKTRYQEAGIAEAIWVHSYGGKEPRPTHLKAGRDKVRFKVAEGWFDSHEGKNVWPGELINCKCVMRPVVVGFT